MIMFGGVTLTKIKCPLHCKCDIFEKYRRAACRNQSLVVVEADIPPQAELLDLSYNLIHELNNHIFVDLNLTSLKLLNLSHNKVSQIHMNAFTDMNNVKTIDLSYNNIEYLLVNWFWQTPVLEELYLGGNNLRKLPDGPILESQSIKVLDLSDCSLMHIPEQTFTKLPNLEVINLSKNSLIQFNVKVIKPLSYLNVLRLENNSWHCNNVMTNLTKYCRKKGISYKDPCVKSQPVVTEEKFQRMIIQPDINTEEPSNSWIYEETEVNQTRIIEVCSNSSNTHEQKDLLMEIIELSPILSVIIPFLLGLGLGLVIACGLAAKPAKKTAKKITPVKRRTSIIRNRRFNDFYEYPLMEPEYFEVSDTTPIPLRKNIYSDSRASDSFM